MQDALDDYIKAYKTLPEEGKAIAGIITVLEKCNADDAKFITAALLERKVSKFTKDFLSYVKKNYLDKNNEAGLEILTKVTYIVNNKEYDQLLLNFKANLYDKTFKLANEQFKLAKFDNAVVLFTQALGFKKTADAEKWIAVGKQLETISRKLMQGMKKDLGTFFEGLRVHRNKYELLEGLLNLCEKHMENADFKKSKYLHKKVAGFKIYKFNGRIDQLKKKEKDLKKKAKEDKKK